MQHQQPKSITDQIRALAATISLADLWCIVYDHPEFLGGTVVGTIEAGELSIDPEDVDVGMVCDRLTEVSWDVLEAAGR